MGWARRSGEQDTRRARERGARAGAVVAALAPAALVALVAAPRARAGVPADGRAVAFSMLDNGDFAETLPVAADEAGVRRVPWWITTRGAAQIVEIDGRPALETRGEDRARQPVPAFAPLAGGIVVRGEVAGRGEVAITDGPGGRAVVEVGSEGGGFEAFEIHARELESVLDRPLVPRLVLELSSRASGGARWRALDVLVPLPLPTEAELAAQIEAELDWILAPWWERALDAGGPRATAFVTHVFDVVTGERIADVPGTYTLPYQLLLDALGARERPEWREPLERYLDDLFALALHPATGIPQSWNGATDVADGEGYVEVASALGFLIDLAERGPERHRERARAAALAIGDTVLARGVLPDGTIAPRYRARDGAPSTSAPHVRRLNLPAELARLGALSGERRFADAADEALARFEYTHFWPGTWSDIDPGFDDEYGNFGARAVQVWRAQPGHPLARRIALGGHEHYAPLWRDALRLGGNVAADQVRCWEVAIDVAELARFDAPRSAELARLLRAALRSHFKGEQYGNGAWGDVTVYGFDPKDNLQVGDLTGLPQNLLQGLAFLYDARTGLRTDETRACYAAVVESSIAVYKRSYGYLATRRELEGHDLPHGSMRFAAGLVEMLTRL